MSRLLHIISSSVEQTEALGEKLAASFHDHDVVVLSGPLGAGKTAFVRGLANGRGLDTKLVNSPSYTFINEYPGKKPIYHFDLYRINDPNELFEIGWEDYLNRSGLVVVEWGEKAERLLPEKYFLIQFKILGDNEREINLSLVQP